MMYMKRYTYGVEMKYKIQVYIQGRGLARAIVEHLDVTRKEPRAISTFPLSRFHL